MLSKSLIKFSVDGRGCVPSLLFGLKPNYGEVNEDNGDLLQKVPCTHCCTQCPQSCNRTLLTHTSTRDSWTFTGKSGLVFCRDTVPFSWLLAHLHKVLFVPSKSLFPQSCGNSVIKSHWPPKSNSLGVLGPFAASPYPGWEICCGS